ncbi:hypothetical protein [Chengkuizengella marina]|uniref:Uncharacterized protein n=1 Tax=Chengkuizengella marina TaxID=2507566 RepID=A0A6N9Q805_9BACL|nr:hypothetical protein [Chengkuizengella marina]NBI30982.1 hypothetical protein [Chengkuizengella marina]
MKLYQLKSGIYEKYCSTVKGNKNTSLDIVQKKLTRNIHLAFKVPKQNENEDKQLYMYGNLRILVVRNTIVWIENKKRQGTRHWFYLDKKKYNQLNKKLGIKKNSTNRKSYLEGNFNFFQKVKYKINYGLRWLL